jgi:hypothetical protein
MAAGALALTLGVFLFRLQRIAIGASAAVAVIVGLSAAVFAPNTQGPAILFLAGLAIVCIVYAVMAVRELGRADPSNKT